MTDLKADIMRLTTEKAAQNKLLREIVEDLEWSMDRTGQSTGSGLNNGTVYPDAACPECGGINPDSGYLMQYREDCRKDRSGHQSGCKIALALGRPTTIPEGENGELTL
jgi:hypothetical protein